MAVAAEPSFTVEPPLREVRELARDHNVIPLRTSFIDDVETPVSAFLKLRGRNPEYPSFLLESAERGQEVGRYSFIGVRPRKVVRWSLGDEPTDPYAHAAAEVARHRQAPWPEMPPFAGGAVGFFGYDLVRTVEPLGEPNPDTLGLPDMALMITDQMLIFDHLRHELYIRAGDAYQVVPSQRFSADIEVEAFSIYRGLRAVNPSPYMYFLQFGDFQIAGASPEPVVKVEGRRVQTRPIAGTYPRGADGEEDRKLAQRLVNDPKERAEHVMLVDLGRNDLGRVCEYGTVKVDELMVVETYSHVLHIVSHVAGKLRPELGPMDVLRSTLPAGTLSGAPKVRAMEIIDELEPHKRGSYGGAVGYLSYTGDLDTAIHIRTVVVKDGRVHVQAGGGTVADAKPAYEYNESVNKARAIFRAVEVACEQP